MKQQFLTSLTLTAGLRPLPSLVEEGGVAHYAPGAVASVMDVRPGRRMFDYDKPFIGRGGDDVWLKAGLAF